MTVQYLAFVLEEESWGKKKEASKLMQEINEKIGHS